MALLTLLLKVRKHVTIISEIRGQSGVMGEYGFTEVNNQKASGNTTSMID